MDLNPEQQEKVNELAEFLRKNGLAMDHEEAQTKAAEILYGEHQGEEMSAKKTKPEPFDPEPPQPEPGPDPDPEPDDDED